MTRRAVQRRVPWRNQRAVFRGVPPPPVGGYGRTEFFNGLIELVETAGRGYVRPMNVRAIVGGKLIRLKLSPGLATAWRENKGRHMSEAEAIQFVERKRRAHALRTAHPYLAPRP